jgi:putative membrane protein insertion efficiency factor
MIRVFLLYSIRFYQLFLSPLKRPSCRFIPTCSEYAYEAIQIYGPIKGLYLSLMRLLRCHPFHPGGYDPVVKRTTEE